MHVVMTVLIQNEASKTTKIHSNPDVAEAVFALYFMADNSE
jgi:hypothetical protein